MPYSQFIGKKNFDFIFKKEKSYYMNLWIQRVYNYKKDIKK